MNRHGNSIEHLHGNYPLMHLGRTARILMAALRTCLVISAAMAIFTFFHGLV